MMHRWHRSWPVPRRARPGLVRLGQAATETGLILALCALAMVGSVGAAATVFPPLFQSIERSVAGAPSGTPIAIPTVTPTPVPTSTPVPTNTPVPPGSPKTK